MDREKPKIKDADLDLLLAESSRDEPFLVAPRTDDLEPREEIDERILAGLVTPS
jgi:hypothetical protein